MFNKIYSYYVIQEQKWQRIYKLGVKRAKELGIKDESDIERLIHKFRQENSEIQCKE